MAPGAENVTGIPALPHTGPEGVNCALGIRGVIVPKAKSSAPVVKVKTALVDAVPLLLLPEEVVGISFHLLVPVLYLVTLMFDIPPAVIGLTSVETVQLRLITAWLPAEVVIVKYSWALAPCNGFSRLLLVGLGL